MLVSIAGAIGIGLVNDSAPVAPAAAAIAPTGIARTAVPTESAGADDTSTPVASVLPESMVGLSVDPKDRVLGVGATQLYTARAVGPKDEDLGDVTRFTSFSIQEPGWCEYDRCGSNEPGEYVVHAAVSLDGRDFVVEATLMVVEVDGLRLQPDDSSIKAGEAQTYTVRGIRRLRGSATSGPVEQDLGDLTTRAVLTIQPPGSCTQAARCTTDKAGTYTVVGTVAGIKAPGRAALRVHPNDPVKLRLSPETAAVSAGVKQAYHAVAVDRYNNVVADVTDDTLFTVSPAGSCDGPRCTADDPGSYTVTGELTGELTGAGVRGQAALTVSAPKLVRLRLEPTSPSVLVGASQTFTAHGLGPGNRDLGDVTKRTVFTIRSPGTCTGSTCSAPVPGSYKVTAAVVGTHLRATTTLTVRPLPLVRVVIDPEVKSIAAGGTWKYKATGFDRAGNPAGDLTAKTTFSISGGGSCSGPSCGADRVGSYIVTGHVLGTGLSGTARLVVEPAPVDRIVIDPVSASVVAGAEQAYSSRGFDKFGNDVGDFTAETMFSIAPKGSCTKARCVAEETGSYTVVGALVGRDVTATADLQVTQAALATAVIDPPVASVAVGAWQSYRVSAYDRFGNAAGDVTGKAVFSIDSGGSCAQNMCTASVARDYTVSIEIVGTSIRAKAQLHVVPGAPAILVLEPAVATISAGASQAYRVSGFDRFGNPLGDVTAQATFSIQPNGSCDGARCTARTPGERTVSVSLAQSGATAHARLTVAAGRPNYVVLDPVIASVASGASITYRATGYDAMGNELGDVTRRTVFSMGEGGSCDGATCNATAPGDFTVTGTEGTGATGEALLHVGAAKPTVNPHERGPVALLRLDPPAASVAAGSSQTYRARAYDARGADLGDVTAQTTFSLQPEGSCAEATCVAEHAGIHSVVGSLGGVRAQARLDVVASQRLAAIVLDPAAGTIGVGAMQTYRAWGFDEFGNSLGEVTDRTTFSIEPTGSCTVASCGAESPGRYVVTGLVRGTAISAPARLQVVPAPLARLVVEPSDSTIPAGSSRTYRARGYDAGGNELGDLTGRTTFTIRPAGSCTAAVCTAPSAGEYIVTAAVAGAPTTPTITTTVPLRVTAAQPVPASGPPWLPIAVGAMVLLAGARLAARVRRRFGRHSGGSNDETDKTDGAPVQQVRAEPHAVPGRTELVERGEQLSPAVRLQPYADTEGTQTVQIEGMP